MNEIEQAAAEHACQKLCIRFHNLIDAGDYEPITDLFTPNAEWVHRTGPLTGHDEIRAYVMAKTKWPVIRHVLTNILIDLDGETRATGRAYVTVYYGEPADGPPALQGPVLVVQYDDVFERTEAGWRFSRRQPRIVFKAEAFARMVHTLDDEKRRRTALGA